MSQEQGYTVEVKKVVSVEMPFPYQQYNVNFVVQGADSSNDSDKNPVPWFSVFKIGDEDARAAIDVYTPGGGDLPVPYNDNGMLQRVQVRPRRRQSQQPRVHCTPALGLVSRSFHCH
jgi:hypothetical protein